jgi:hypothetical protein
LSYRLQRVAHHMESPATQVSTPLQPDSWPSDRPAHAVNSAGTMPRGARGRPVRPIEVRPPAESAQRTFTDTDDRSICSRLRRNELLRRGPPAACPPDTCSPTGRCGWSPGKAGDYRSHRYRAPSGGGLGYRIGKRASTALPSSRRPRIPTVFAKAETWRNAPSRGPRSPAFAGGRGQQVRGTSKRIDNAGRRRLCSLRSIYAASGCRVGRAIEGLSTSRERWGSGSPPRAGRIRLAISGEIGSL